jgi:probable F420-dependent oxidoreductase
MPRCQGSTAGGTAAIRAEFGPWQVHVLRPEPASGLVYRPSTDSGSLHGSGDVAVVGAWRGRRAGAHGRVPKIQFGVNVHSAASGVDFERLVRRADVPGFDVFAAPDHLGFLAPFAALAAAGMVSARLRLRTYVLNAGFWNPALLAREVATLDVLSGGRAELGLGAGHMKREHDDAGLAWAPLGEQIRLTEETLAEVGRRLADAAMVPRPVQQPVPVMIGAMSAAGLSVAARRADIVGFAGLRQIARRPAGTFTLCSAAQTRQRVDQVRAHAAGRPYRSDVLLQAVVIGPDPDKTASQWVAEEPDLTVEQVLDSPFVLLAEDAAHAAATLRHRQDVYGFDSVTTHQPSLEPLGEVIAAYRAAST